MRIGGLAALVGVALCLLVLRAWSIQILHGPAYTSLANGQAYRTVDLAGPRGAIVDAKGRVLAATTGHLVVAADVAALGEIDSKGWHPSSDGLASLAKLSKLAHVPVPTLVVAGARDPATPPDHSRLIASKIPGARVVELEAAHLSNIEARERFTASVLEFLIA